jgi:two-component sensor histidine kinase
MVRFTLGLLFFFWIWSTNATAEERLRHLLPSATVFITDANPSSAAIPDATYFQPYSRPYINIGTRKHSVWIALNITNDTNVSITKALILTSPLLETVRLYRDGNVSRTEEKGVSSLHASRNTLHPYFTLKLPPHSSTTLHLYIHSHYTPVDTAVLLADEGDFIRIDRNRQFQIILLIGFILALALYSFVLFLYTKDRAYAYYGLYLLALIYQQMTYLGLTQIYLPDWFNAVDMRIPVIKITLLIITAALFAMHFLKIDKNGKLHRTYIAFVYIALAEMAILNLTPFYNLDIVIFTGAAFITFNLAAGIVRYAQGFKEARFFIAGFAVVFLSYALIILDALGVSTIMQRFQSLLIYGTAFEALVLSLAFADRYLILKREKAAVDKAIKHEYETRQKRITEEVERKTKALNDALHTKELLVHEIHHRVKNNLQLILSILRLQKDECEDSSLQATLDDLEYRIGAIAKSYELLLTTDKPEEIDMQQYIEALAEEIRIGYGKAYENIDMHIECAITLPLKQAVYLGLILNELVTNAFKHAFVPEIQGRISIVMQRHSDKLVVFVRDSTDGFAFDKAEGLGLTLIKTLVRQQLRGTIKYDSTRNRYIIEVPL